MGLQGPSGPRGKDTLLICLLETQEFIFTFNLFYFTLHYINLLLTYSRPPKKNFVEVTELTDITYMSNLAKLRPGHMNIVLVLTDASKNILLSKFAKEVYSFTG